MTATCGQPGKEKPTVAFVGATLIEALAQQTSQMVRFCLPLPVSLQFWTELFLMCANHEAVAPRCPLRVEQLVFV